jgi:hypothetical protein
VDLRKMRIGPYRDPIKALVHCAGVDEHALLADNGAAKPPHAEARPPQSVVPGAFQQA